MSKRKKAAIAAACAIIVLIVGLALAIPSCSNDADDAAENVTAEKSATTGKDSEKDGVTAKSTVDSDAAKESASSESEEAAKTDENKSNPAPQSSGASSSSGSKSDPAPSKKWAPDYKKVWVEDSAAWDEQVPIYDEVEVSICNVCGAEITGNEAPHAKAHALAGEGGGHHNDYRSVLVGYETLHHEPAGHYETVENGGHWE